MIKNYFTVNKKFLQDNDYEFSIAETMKTSTLYFDETKIFYSDIPYDIQELALIRRIKLGIKKSPLYNMFVKEVKNEDGFIVNENDVYRFYKLKNEVQYNYLFKRTASWMVKRAQKDLFVIDLNNAYTSFAILLGFIDMKSYERLIKLKEKYKAKKLKNKNINYLLGACFMTSKVHSDFKGRKMINSKLEENPSEIFWVLITWICDKILRKICANMKDYGTKEKPEPCVLSYFVDGIFFNCSKTPISFIQFEFEENFNIAFREVFMELLDRFKIPLDLIGENKFVCAWKFDFGKVIDLRPADSFLKVLVNEREKPFQYSTRTNTRMFN